ncbi:tetratricopeptide repeat protein [Thioclava sp. SK-1]|uniref:tetratricopeptide repeat protein n=1 Tax=Thioclava sp. SK-1 TaxID=1889770 RepID=UPI0008252410|nr:tetratricopeptide repeat protein [Thioclava sp. SK-1]
MLGATDFPVVGDALNKIILAACVALMISGCDSAEEQAAKHLAQAQSYIAQGDTPRAIVELRNALQKDDDLQEARSLLAEQLIAAGRETEAFGQYRQIAEADPDNLIANRQMALIALDVLAWDDAARYGAAALQLAPDDPQLLAAQVVLDYRTAAMARDTAQMDRAAARAQALLDADPGALRARRVVIANLLQQNRLEQVLAVVDAGLERQPQDRDLNNVRLLVLGRLNRTDETEAQIRSMIDTWPEDEELGRVLVQFYLTEGRSDEARSWLLDQIDPQDDDPQARILYLRFLAELDSPAVMRDALTDMLSQSPAPADISANETVFRALKAGADFTLGDEDAAMSDLENLLKGAEPSEEINRVRIQLARMRQASGNPVGSQALVEEVLAQDAGQSDALKMKAAWLITDDQTEEAVLTLRAALANDPTDAQAMTLMAQAYQREGRTQLMADMLARAVEASNQGAAESLQYVGYLSSQSQFRSAETILIDALRRQPQNMALLQTLAGVHLQMKDWGRLRQDVAAIRSRFPDERGQALADELQAQMLAGLGRNDELDVFLKTLADQSAGDLGAQIAVIRNTVKSGNITQARNEAMALENAYPDAPQVAVLLAQIDAANNQTAPARERLSKLIQTHSDFEPAWTMLYVLQMRAGEGEKARETLGAAVQALPDSRRLNMMQAGQDERDGDIEAAIAIYEKLYAADSSDTIVANNLASLLAATRADEASLERAWVVARRLNGATEPAFRDTYGWLAFRRGNVEVALPELIAAAQGLPQDPSVAYHLGRAQAASGNQEAAQAEYARAQMLIDGGATAYPGLERAIQSAQEALLR